MRIESALAVRRVKTKGEFNGDVWLGFERLTCVPIQTRMVKDAMLSKEEKQWLKVRLQLLSFVLVILCDCRNTTNVAETSSNHTSKTTSVR
jgi:Xaa-Pro aminopeptidase